MHRCAAVFNGERGGIKGAKVSNIVGEIDDAAGSLDERQTNDHIDRYMWARSN
jgi:hypothetical protein